MTATKSRVLLFLLIVGLLSVLFHFEVAYADLSDTERKHARSAASAFLLKEFPAEADTLSKSVEVDLEIEEQKFNPTFGRTVILVTPEPHSILTVDLIEGRVVAAYFPSKAPRSMASITMEQSAVPRERLFEELVNCKEVTAFEAATGFLFRHFGSAVLDDLVSVDSGLDFHGSFFVYRYSWRESTDENSVALNFESIRVEVDPGSCEVFRFSRIAIVPSRRPMISAREAGEAVLRFNRERQFSDMERTCLIELLREDGAPIPAWVISYRHKSIDGSENETIESFVYYVHGDTGRVYQSARDLSTSAEVVQ